VKIIIVGAGEVGFHIAQRLSGENQDVVIIDKDPGKIKRITDNLDVQSLLGSGTSPEMLKGAGIRDADMLIAATDSDEVNLIACLLARHLNPHILKAARIRNPEYLEERDLFSRELLGIDHIINPESVMVETIRNVMMIPGASDVIDFEEGRVKLVGITIKPDAPFAGRQLQSLRGVESKLLVGAVVRGENVFIPHGQDVIEANDLIYVVAAAEALDHLFSLFNIEEEALRRVIIVGAGQTGTSLARALEKTKINIKIIERDSDKCNSLAENLKRVTVIHGDGTDKALLQEENIYNTDFMVSLTGDEESNVLISLLAKGLGAKRCHRH
jgi:trk system potassium uptake protein TrkA